MNSLEIVIIVLIFLLTGWGVVDFFRTIALLRKEQERLEDFRDPQKSPGRYFLDGLLEDVEQKELLAELDAKEKSEGRLLMVEQRWATMLKAVKADNPVRQVPSFTSLRAINLQQSYAMHTVWLRVIMPMLLVLGILGTLVGVHEALSLSLTEEEGKERLLICVSEALLPGILATSCTIILMLCRGVYRHLFSHIMTELDNLTLGVFLPSLQIQSHMGESVDSFCDNIAKLTDFTRICNEVHTELEQGQHSLHAACNIFSSGGAMLSLGLDVASLSEYFNALAADRLEYARIQPQIVAALESICLRQQAMGELLSEIEELALEHGAAVWAGSVEGTHTMRPPLEALASLRASLQYAKRQKETLCNTVKSQLTTWNKQADDISTKVHDALKMATEQGEQLETLAKQLSAADEALRFIQECIGYFQQSVPLFRQKAGVVSAQVVVSRYEHAFESYHQACDGLRRAHRACIELFSHLSTRLKDYHDGLSFWSRVWGMLCTRFSLMCSPVKRWWARNLSFLRKLLWGTVGVVVLAVGGLLYLGSATSAPPQDARQKGGAKSSSASKESSRKPRENKPRQDETASPARRADAPAQGAPGLIGEAGLSKPATSEDMNLPQAQDPLSSQGEETEDEEPYDYNL